ncbi:Bin3-domain-containing protein [Wolfiporia cocos MD-104 SS10]|uniref:RNA methyltransferase n=1 Tax=Wolfiporia cocos (strain MD-104) TaxID=742152 RepID=A0A2H3JZA5_WOLCO|nr:Bin3-domain-containing protein [Wolfiporia cocos MD-104 SS10]
MATRTKLQVDATVVPSSFQPIFGNYRGYYTKRPFVTDPRLAVLPSSIFSGACVLDIGCNEGWVTCEIAQSKGAKKVVGVDIDDTLIRAAWKRRRYVWSLQEPVDDGEFPDDTPDGRADEQPAPKKRRRDSDVSTLAGAEHPRRPRTDYFPASSEHMFGPLPIPPTEHGSGNVPELFPHNVTFRTADWVSNDIPEDMGGYDVVVAFSVSKWIHLNGGDEGIMQFFRRVYSVLRPGGTFILEVQEWDTYAKARRMDPKLKETAKNLQLRPHDFEEILRGIGFGPAEHLGKVGQGGFCRPIDVYRKTK